MVNVSAPLEVVPYQTTLGKSSFDAPMTANLERECRSQACDKSPVPVPAEHGASTFLQPRSYQREMLEQSLERNIIVAMDTGSGKTQIAVLRIARELERCLPDKLVWFLAPTVALAQQQHHVIGSQLPAFQLRLLLGADHVELWSEQHIWDSVLLNVRIVVSTHQILLDALTHGFVRMSRLALLIFDEAHHCVSSHPANRIMQEFYHNQSSPDTPFSKPHILGLTASPTVNAKPGSLETLERNLDAISRSPAVHRQEMLEYVYPPDVIHLVYQPCHWTSQAASGALQSLHSVYQSLDIWQDPYVVRLAASSSVSSRRQLNKVLLNRKTYCHDQISTLHRKSIRLFEELGCWAVEQYLFLCIEKFKSHVDDESILLQDWDNEEKAYLRELLDRVVISPPSTPVSFEGCQLSDKALRFIHFLTRQDVSDFTGLVFLDERATVSMLSHLLAIHPLTKDTFTASTFVGTSNSSKRKLSIGELLDVRSQKGTLDHLKSGKTNLVIATSVLEEGIDVSACNIVICYNKPATLKSFIQRRGRARKERSKLVLMVDSDDPFTLDRWHELEDDMKKAYLDEMRQYEAYQKKEDIDGQRSRFLRIDGTGALLTLDNAVQHLYHFCATLPANPYIDSSPEFLIFEHGGGELVSAKVILPNSVDLSVREAHGTSYWGSERYAKRDAAFEAYVALHKAGLVNDHLLPLLERDSDVVDESTAVEIRAALIEVADQLNPWRCVAHNWEEARELQKVDIDVSNDGALPLRMVMIMPQSCPVIADFPLYWDTTTGLKISLNIDSDSVYTLNHVFQASRVSALILHSVFGSRMEKERYDFPALFVPRIEPWHLESWLTTFTGSQPASDISATCLDSGHQGLVREQTRQGLAYILKDFTRTLPKSDQNTLSVTVPASPEALFLKLMRLPKRRNFLHPIMSGVQTDAVADSKAEYLPASSCLVDRLPFPYSRFGLFIPSIMHRLEIFMVAEQLCKEVLGEVAFDDLGLVVTALSASGANEATDYQRLEFLGDSILKFFTSITLMAEHLTWHEGFLSAKKDRVVANARLSRAAVEVGLDRYILTKQFTSQKWRPPYVSELLRSRTESRRQMSTKILADVVEALIGAAFLDGDAESASSCLKVFIPEIPWLSLDQRHITLYEGANPIDIFPPRFKELERLVGYTFNKKTLLVEAMTHASYSGSNTAMSYQRLEFLGDSVLDYVVVTGVFRDQKELKHYRMHTMRTALVNAGFLAFLCMDHAITEARAEVVEDKATQTFHPFTSAVALHIWQFMRHTSPQLTRAQMACVDRYQELCASIKDSLWRGRHYPWALLARLEADKFFSDLIESLVGAIYIDSHGCLSSCEKFLETIGVLPYLRRILEGNIKLLHPKEEVGQLADTEQVKYVHGLQEGKRAYWCQVFVGAREVVRVGDGTSRFEVETRAAERAVEILLLEKKRPQVSADGPDEDMTE